MRDKAILSGFSFTIIFSLNLSFFFRPFTYPVSDVAIVYFFLIETTATSLFECLLWQHNPTWFNIYDLGTSLVKINLAF